MRIRPNLIYWIWLSEVLGHASITANTVLKYFRDPERVWLADREELESCNIEWRGKLESLLDKDLTRSEGILDYCEKNSVGIMTLDDCFYPERLKALVDRPIVMYYLGSFCDIDASACVAVVGSRDPTEYGIHAAKRISYDLARAGAVIVSGMALGIDACAHSAAIYNNSPTIAVLGCGIDRIYPEQNRKLYEEVYKNGLVLTEFSPGTKPEGWHFPTRNRIISGLSAATVVVEAAVGSGSLITAEYAVKQTRLLYAVPSGIFQPKARGSNNLLKYGAKPLLDADDLIEVLAKDFKSVTFISPSRLNPVKKPRGKQKKPGKFEGERRVSLGEEPIPPEYKDAPESPERQITQPSVSIFELTEDERAVLSLLSGEPKSVDELMSPFSPQKTVRILSSLELKGHASGLAGGRYALSE